ncbi:hypothetical protein H4R20_003724, partial [Coemansia guatemalensis]
MRLRTAITIGYIDSHPAIVATIITFMLASFATLILECQSRPEKLYELIEGDDGTYSTLYSPEERSNIFSKITYSWLTPLLEQGIRKPLEMEDIYEVTKDLRPNIVFGVFQQSWKNEQSSGNPSLFRATIKACGWKWACSIITRFIRDMLVLLHPVLLSRLIGFVMTYNTTKAEPIENGYFYAVAIFVII